ncbi:MAG: polyprenyl synthetase family protein [Deltaproteobacteria bacterium]|nr:polyprenyl synthetase family protein [Deltaproteobacteria bacterium]
MTDIKKYLTEKKAVIDNALKAYLPQPEGPTADMVKAMTYSLFAGGKRLRPILCMAGAEAVGGDGIKVLPVACGLEMIHTYSLIHDDLPAMDDDQLRRGKPTSHIVFGEAMAILAGDGLLTEAFHLMTRPDVIEAFDPENLLQVIHLIAEAAGYQGMVGGQAMDIQTQGREIDPSLVEFTHAHKTGALIAAAVTSGAILSNGTEDQIKAIQTYGARIGLAFQISDDILDIEGDVINTGKGIGGDVKKGKNTYPSVFGLDNAKNVLKKTVEKALAGMEPFDQKADPLKMIATYIMKRRK